MKKNTILHISGDYPDSIRKDNKTHAVYNLITSSHQFNHLIVSLNRSSVLKRNLFLKKDNLIEIEYFRLPFGILINSSLLILARKIEKKLRADNIHFDVIHAHKLTIEGVIANYLSRKFNKPYVTTIRGLTDLAIMRFKPFSGFVYKNILANSSKLFFLAPWSENTIKNKFTNIAIDKKSILLPNIVSRSEVASQKKRIISNRFITSARLNAPNYKNKNLLRTIKAFDIASKNLNDIHLDIYLSGEGNHKDDLLKAISVLSCKNNIHLYPPLSNNDFINILPDYVAYLLPSFPETFGMAYFEAIFAGIPVLHSKGTGIDGYFNNKKISCRANHRSTDAIAGSIIDLHNNQQVYKLNIFKCLETGYFDSFFKESIINNYQDCIAKLFNN